MSQMVQLEAADGHRLNAYLAEPPSAPRGGLVMIQEIFGLTAQMQRCADRYAEAGYRVVLPAMFDRVQPGLVLGYTDFQAGGKAAMSIEETAVLADVEAARQMAAIAGPVAIMGFCWGGTVAYQAASTLPFACAVAYYGGGIGRLVDRLQPRVPVQYHFGGEDHFIPPAIIERIRGADPGGAFYVYAGAGHGFACDDREGYDPQAAALAEERALAFLAAHA